MAGIEELVLMAIVVACSSLMMIFMSWRRRSRRRMMAMTLPPGPRGWPILGNLAQVSSKHPHREMASLCQKYGPLVYLRLGKVHAITTDDPNVVRELLLRQDDVFASRPRTLAAVHLAYACRDVALAPLGRHWKWMRRVCVEHLLTPRRLDFFAAHRAGEARHLIGEIRAKTDAGEVVNLRDVLGAFSMNNITWMLLGKQFYGAANSGGSDGAAEFMRLTHELFSLLGVIYAGDYLPWWRWIDPFGLENKMRKLERKIDAFHQNIIDEHKKKKKEEEDGHHEIMDFVDVLLSLPGEDGVGPMLDVEVKALMQDMIAAATDTSAVTSEWAMAELLRHPKSLRSAQAELDTVVGRNRQVAESDLPNLPYLRCIVRETFRLHPAGPFLIPHESLRPTKLLGYDIPAGTRVFINTHALGRNPKVWPDGDVESFRPERHITVDEGDAGYRRVEISHGEDFSILPFGAGRRRCPGAKIGELMVMAALGTLIHCFEWAPPEGEEIDVEEVYGMTMPKARPLLAVANTRLPPHLY